MSKKYLIRTFGCQQNTADSERIAASYEARGFVPTETLADADLVVINTCMVREKAEERVYGLVRNIRDGQGKKDAEIVVTGCLVGAVAREPSGKMRKKVTSRLPDVTLLPIEEVGFEHVPKRADGKLASIVIGNGCGNFCSYCIVPYSRGKEMSRPFSDILEEVGTAVAEGHDEILLLGQNVNSYGADFLVDHISEGESYRLPDGRDVVPVMVSHLGKHRIPTLFPHLLETVAKIPGVRKVMFLSSNPWDFSDELISVIANNANIDRMLHLPVQAGSDRVLKSMNRWYVRDEYLALVERIRTAVPEVLLTTDIIVGFPGETAEDFEATLDIVRQVRFHKAYLACYSARPGTVSSKLSDDVPREEKVRRFHELDRIVLTLAGRDHLLGK
ncbi:MAG: MiaB/RimO family radical SAM methylthiotransferase [Candidatus Moranbacteria bacterium]|nr:MiaB/RimO family radical SAM methylthiotransferase [Candidatus Moranbacteria bacterium]